MNNIENKIKKVDDYYFYKILTPTFVNGKLIKPGKFNKVNYAFLNKGLNVIIENGKTFTVVI